MADVFISYASEDRERARALAETLETRGWTVWWDRQILPGETFESVIERELACADCVLVLWSESSVQSHWAKAEADEALNRGVLVPALIDDVRIPIAFRHVQAASLIDWTPDDAGHAGFTMLEQSIRNLDRPDPVTGQTAAGVGADASARARPPSRPSPTTRMDPQAGRATAATGGGAPRRGGWLSAHPRLAVAAGLALVVVGGMIGAKMVGGGDYTDAEDPVDVADAAIASREEEALDNGYEIVYAWTVDHIDVDQPLVYRIEAEAGTTYEVLGSTTSDCELDIDFGDSSTPFRSVDRFGFTTDEAGDVNIQLTVRSETAASCAVGNGTYRLRSPAASN